MTADSDPVRDAAQSQIHHVEARVHGRYLVRAPNGSGPWPLLVGFHGYGEDAAVHLRELARIPGSETWLIAAVQALHPFYARGERVVASWMTSQDREHAIADNIEYVRRVVADVRARYPARKTLVFAGFSQGGAMAYRAAAHEPSAGVIILAADVPPDVAAGPVVPLPGVLIGRGSREEWFTEAKLSGDLQTLERLGIGAEVCRFDGGHEWTDAFREAAGRALHRALAAG